jgi:hypothetical protein
MYVNVPSVKFHENLSSVSRADTYGQMDGHDTTNRLSFIVYVNAPEKFTRPIIRGAECV